VRAPRIAVVSFAACAGVTLAFIATAPWGKLRHLDPVLGVWAVAFLALMFHAPSRAWLLDRDVTFTRRVLLIALVAVFAFQMRSNVSRYDALEVNAWDFSLSFDRPIERTLHGELLWSEDLRHSMLGVHANWLLLAFVPLYAIAASPWWLIVAQAAAIAGAVAVLFAFARAVAGDDFLAACLALAFLLNRYTARAAQFLFTIDVFYPLALFLLFHAFVRRRPRSFALALLLTLAIKEDAILPLIGFALVAAAAKQWRYAIGTVVAAASVFALDFFVVIPSFSHWTGAAYAQNWGSFGATPIRAVGGMLLSPVKVLARVAEGGFGLLATLGFAPLAGWPWLLSGLPPLVIAGSSDANNVHYFSLHYAMPVLPGLFAATTFAVARGRTRRARRIAALVVLATSALIGATYEFNAPRPERRLIRKLARAAAPRIVYVQGALLPHAGYATNLRALHHTIVPPPGSAYLVCATCNPYPFTRDELAQRIEGLRGRGYEEMRMGGLSYFYLLRSR
jgi:uncharacterized membrane protein